MPFVSKKQQRFLEANPDKIGGKAKLKEWEGATDFSSLPESSEAMAQEGKTSRPKKFQYKPKVKAGYSREERAA